MASMLGAELMHSAQDSFSPTYPYVDVRRVIQPGPVRHGRVLTAVTRPSRTVVATLPEGAILFEAVSALFANQGACCGVILLLGGVLSTAVYHVATPNGVSLRAVEYGAGIVIAGGARIVSASGSFGPAVSGDPFLHLHAALADNQGTTHGGHVGVGHSVIGVGGVRVLATMGVGFVQRYDPETAYPTFFPQSGDGVWTSAPTR